MMMFAIYKGGTCRLEESVYKYEDLNPTAGTPFRTFIIQLEKRINKIGLPKQPLKKINYRQKTVWGILFLVEFPIVFAFVFFFSIVRIFFCFVPRFVIKG